MPTICHDGRQMRRALYHPDRHLSHPQPPFEVFQRYHIPLLAAAAYVERIISIIDNIYICISEPCHVIHVHVESTRLCSSPNVQQALLQS